MRVAIDCLLQLKGCQDRLFSSYFVESDLTLAHAVARVWARAAEARGVTPHTRLALNVWDLLDTPDILHAFLAQVPRGALLLVAGGPPCQDLTNAGSSGGALGLAGERSSHFYIFPGLCRVVQFARPDLNVHVMVENAGSLLPLHREAILTSLGLTAGSGPIIDAGPWSHFSRARTFFSSLPYEQGAPPLTPPSPF